MQYLFAAVNAADLRARDGAVSLWLGPVRTQGSRERGGSAGRLPPLIPLPPS